MRERGAALITTIMVLLVLSVLGITFSMLMTQEDRTSGRQDVQKLAFYAAEAGLRRGERVLRAVKLLAVNAYLSNPSTIRQAWQIQPALPQVPVAGDLSSWDPDHLGTYLREGGTQLANVEIPMPGSGKRAFYSVYIRDNPDDGSANPLVTNDTRVRLVAVGWVANDPDPDRPMSVRRVAAVKILEEEFNWTGLGIAESAQKLVDPGGTGSGAFTEFNF
ncbi:MAG: PilX N-terminal domain-containing pilus assembly protein [Thermoanaerobaculum sp.]